MTLAIVLLIICTTVWAGFDATKRDWTGRTQPVVWIIAMVLLWIIIFPLYLLERRRVPLKPAV